MLRWERQKNAKDDANRQEEKKETQDKVPGWNKWSYDGNWFKREGCIELDTLEKKDPTVATLNGKRRQLQSPPQNIFCLSAFCFPPLE